jgi:RNA polymerase sigma-70 factor (ECF subfamily)
LSTPDNHEDPTLARLARDGSSAAFGMLVKRYHVRVFAFLMTLTKHRQDAEDLTQETFLRAWDKIHRYDPALPLLPWLFTIARRQSIAALRRKKPLPEVVDGIDQSEPTNASLRLWELARRELPTESYSALWLHYREELPLKEVAVVLGKREGAVKVILHRARKVLAERARGSATLAHPPSLPEPQGTMP